MRSVNNHKRYTHAWGQVPRRVSKHNSKRVSIKSGWVRSDEARDTPEGNIVWKEYARITIERNNIEVPTTRGACVTGDVIVAVLGN